ncbi:MAG: 23S rRNA (guanosine(2251)-2'-O)-methyltransferase RlmB [Nitrospirota bacterium]
MKTASDSKHKQSQQERIFGIHPLMEALQGGRSVERIYIAKGRGGTAVEDLIRLARSKGVPLHFEPREVLDRIIGSTKHQGVMGLVAAKAYGTLEEILSRASSRGEAAAVLVLDGIEDPRNLGAVLRTADAAGFHGVIIPQRRAAGLTETVAKASAGALEYVTVARVVNLTQALGALKAAGLWIYGLDPGAEKSYLALDYRGPTALVVGAEGGGISRLVLSGCDERVRLPMKGRVASLNVSVAVGVMAYEILRQRSR